MIARGGKPPVAVISNENPDWPEIDKIYADDQWHLLLSGLESQGYMVRALKFFEDLRCLDGYDPRKWLVWNWGEEWGGIPWSEAQVADELERRGFAYTGSTPDVLRLTTDRMRVKQVLRDAGLPTPPARVFGDPAQAVEWTDFPAIVKGANQHASVGIDRESVVSNVDELARRIRHMREQFADDSLVEPFLDTREFHVAVWGNATPEALPPSEISYATFPEMCDRLYTRAWKFERESRGYLEIQMPCPAPADRPDWRTRIENVAVDAYRVLGLRDYARFDMRMLGDEPQILDVNSNPELGPESVLLAGAKQNGLDYGQMADRIAQFAAVRMPRS